MTSPIEELKLIMERLRDPDTGCPWDKKQSFQSIIPCTIEETYEVIDAIHNNDWDNLREELGDLLFQVVFYSQLAKENNLFDFNDVICELNKKMIRRHPHVFSEQHFDNEYDIIENWEKIKQQEKIENKVLKGKSIFDTIPNSLPALNRAMKIQKKCAKHGFDWTTLEPVVDKVKEELEEVMEETKRSSVAPEKVEEELGDLLFSTVNLSRHLECDPDVALQKANLKFIRRFRKIESLIHNQNKTLDDFSLDELDKLWDKVKVIEQQESKLD